jgi:hypothetical protein
MTLKHYIRMVKRLCEAGYPTAKAVLAVVNAYHLSMGHMELIWDAVNTK